LAKPVMFPLGRSRRPTGSPLVKTMGIVRVSRGNGRRGRACQDDVGLQADQLLRQLPYLIDVTSAPTRVHPHVAANEPAQARKRLGECRDVSLPHGIVFVAPDEHAMRRTRSPCCPRAASGHAAAPPSPAMNSRRRRQMLTWPFLAREPIEAEYHGPSASKNKIRMI